MVVGQCQMLAWLVCVFRFLAVYWLFEFFCCGNDGWSDAGISIPFFSIIFSVSVVIVTVDQ